MRIFVEEEALGYVECPHCEYGHTYDPDSFPNAAIYVCAVCAMEFALDIDVTFTTWKLTEDTTDGE